MKKVLAFFLSLTLLCGAVAFAENDNKITNESTSNEASTTVSYTIEANQSYVVTIPASLPLVKQSYNKLEATLRIKIEATNFNQLGKKIVVKLKSASRVLTNTTSTNTIPYKIATDMTSLKQVADGAEILTWTSGSTPTTVNGSLFVYTSEQLDETLPAGTYSDDITFIVSVDDITTDVG